MNKSSASTHNKYKTGTISITMTVDIFRRVNTQGTIYAIHYLLKYGRILNKRLVRNELTQHEHSNCGINNLSRSR